MKIWLIGLYSDDEVSDSVEDIVKATTSYEAAKQYVLDMIERHKANPDHSGFSSCEIEMKRSWSMKYMYVPTGNTHEYIYRIQPIELIDSEDVPEPRRPELEKRCESLEKHNDELKSEVAELRKNVSAAQCYLTFWDGGAHEDPEHVLDNVHKAKTILRGGEEGNAYILDLFNGWKKNEEDRRSDAHE